MPPILDPNQRRNVFVRRVTDALAEIDRILAGNAKWLPYRDGFEGLRDNLAVIVRAGGVR